MNKYFVIHKGKDQAVLVGKKGKKVEKICGDFDLTSDIYDVNKSGMVVGEGYSLEIVSKKQADDLLEFHQKRLKSQCIEMIVKISSKGVCGGMMRMS